MHAWRRVAILLTASIMPVLLVAGAGRLEGQMSLRHGDWPLRFDFGPAGGRLQKGAIPVSPKTRYTSDRAYGLIGGSYRGLELDEEVLELADMLGDAVASSDSVVFRVDVPPGDYWLELFLPGGRFTAWRGSVRVNGRTLLQDSLPFRWSYESEDPPPTWAFLEKVSAEEQGLTLSVAAEGQESMLAGLAIFPAELGPLAWKDGKVVALRPLSFPNSELLLRTINAGAVEEAAGLLAAVPEEDPELAFEKAVLLMALAGRLELENARPWVEWASDILSRADVAQVDPSVPLHRRLLELFLLADRYYEMRGWDWARARTGFGIFERCDFAAQAFRRVARVTEHPLQPRALWRLGKASYWLWLEQHELHQKRIADSCFAVLLRFFPSHRLLRMYAGERIRSVGDTLKRPEAVPEWAYYANRALRGVLDIIHYWVENRQADNGEMGGKYDDDVEMLRWWAVAVLAADDSLARLGIRRIVEGIWHSDWVEDGFSRRVRDVEHASEPLADTQPMMIGFDYGNPIYVERCMLAVRKMLDLWTGVNARGHRHFRSGWYSATEVDARPPRDCDLPMNTRTVSAARWLAWYNRHALAMRFLQEWTRAWVEDCLRTDKGKPYGVVPPAIRFHDDAIGGHSDLWYRPGLFWSYYDFRGGFRMLSQFLASFSLLEERAYLEPVRIALELVHRYRNHVDQAAPEGSEAWVAGILSGSRHLGWTGYLLRLLSGDRSYDSLLVNVGPEYVRFAITGESAHLTKACQSLTRLTEYNRELLTTEAYFTDRVDIWDPRGKERGDIANLEAMYTGAPFLESFFPFYRVSWEGFGDSLAAAVVRASDEEVVVRAVNLGRAAARGLVHFWNLPAGAYRFRLVSDGPSENRPERAQQEEASRWVHWGHAAFEVNLPAKSPVVLELRLKQKAAQKWPEPTPDLAIVREEVQWARGDGRIRVRVHNIGTAEARNVVVRAVRLRNGVERLLSERTIERLEAPLDLRPRAVEVELAVPERKPGETWMVLVDPDDRIREITETNNRAVF